MPGDSITAGQSSGNLNFSTAQKIINRLLTCERIKTELDEGKTIGLNSYSEPEIKMRAFTKQELAEKLGISQEEFEKLKMPSFYKSMVDKISLSLIRLYCSTKFVDDDECMVDKLPYL